MILAFKINTLKTCLVRKFSFTGSSLNKFRVNIICLQLIYLCNCSNKIEVTRSKIVHAINFPKNLILSCIGSFAYFIILIGPWNYKITLSLSLLIFSCAVFVYPSFANPALVVVPNSVLCKSPSQTAHIYQTY